MLSFLGVQSSVNILRCTALSFVGLLVTRRDEAPVVVRDGRERQGLEEERDGKGEAGDADQDVVEQLDGVEERGSRELAIGIGSVRSTASARRHAQSWDRADDAEQAE